MRTLLRAFLVIVLVVLGAFVLLGYRTGSSWRTAERREAPAPAAGTTGIIDTEKVRERGADLAEKAAIATEKVRETAHEAAITAKIKAKMALDDSVKARAIDVSTNGTTVTVGGTVGSVRE